MKLNYFIIVFMLCHVCSAQLSVSNSNYIFTSDAYIYIEDDLELVDSNSNIYLRNDGQLLQGSGTTGNSGIGNLSVYQSGSSNEYAYNYWCSPIGNNDANTNGNRDFRVNLLDDATGTLTSTDALFTSGYNGIATPLTIASPWLYTFQTSSNYSQWSYAGSAGAISPGIGFTMKGTNGSGDNQLYDFRGKPNNGDIVSAVNTAEWTLVGNPYPSTIDALEFIHDSDNIASITGTLYYWDQNVGQTSHNLADYEGGYATYTITAGGVETSTPATYSSFDNSGNVVVNPGLGPGSFEPTRYIPIGYGFMVEGIASDFFYLKNAHREYHSSGGTRSSSSDGTQYNEHGYNIVPQDFKRFRINVILNDTYTRQLVQNFHATATNGFDHGMESKSPQGVASDAYWILNDSPYVIQAHNYNTALTIPLVVKLTSQQTVRVNIFDIQHFDENQPIYLHDIESNSYTDLRTQDFNITLGTGTYDNRFEITFEIEDTLGNTEVTFEDFNIIQNNNTNELVIKNPNGLDIQSLDIVDTAGKLVLNQLNLGNQNTIRLSTKTMSNGVYIATTKTKNNQSLSKKIIINNNH